MSYLFVIMSSVSLIGDATMFNLLIRLIGWKAILLHGDPLHLDRWKWLKRHLAPGPLRTLDAGCGAGAYTMYAATIGSESIGISSDKKNNQNVEYRARISRIPNVKFITADLRNLSNLKAEIGMFDRILCLDTIEHIQNDEKLIEDLSSVLKPSGRIFLTTPYKNYRHLVNDKLSKYEDGGHVRWGYTHEEIRTLFNKHGLDVESEEYISGFISQQLTNLARLLGKVNKKFAWALTFPFKILQLLDPLFTRLIRYPHFGIAVVGVKRRP